MKKHWRHIEDEKEFIKFFERPDFSEYVDAGLKSGQLRMRRVKFIFPQDKLISIRLSSRLIETLKKTAQFHKTKYQKLIRLILEEHVGEYLPRETTGAKRAKKRRPVRGRR